MMYRLNSIRKWLFVIVAGMIVLLGAFSIPSQVLAQGKSPLQTEDSNQSAVRLEELLQRQLDLLLKQDERLAKAEQTIPQIEERIQSLNEQGVDTTEAQAALNAFIAEIAEAEDSYTTAELILEKADGFDADGNVIDSQAALETLRTAGTEQRQFHLTLSNASRNLRIALQDTIADTRLEKLFSRQQEIQEKQGERLVKAEEVRLRMEEFIQEEQEAARDTSILEDALDAFEVAIADATTDHEKAEKLIASRAGFDSNGQVADLQAAKETVRETGAAQRSFHLTAAQATVDLRQSIRAYQELWDEAHDRKV